MVSHEKKHTVAFCISAIAFCVGISLIAAVLTKIAPLIAIIVSTIIGAITILSACQAIESYSVIKNSNKVTSSLHKIKEAFTGKESELFIEKVFNHLCGFFSSEKESSTQR
ncbi:WD_0736 family protein [Wolbachia endosymbiont (group A) of Sturmia bella]|uniref:WD_0736 family protein n=1 Tax=Wolbachia endosymbiont (group A) of Sturmia bella TaxID=3139315 RepID=UPI003CCAF7B3